MDKKYVEEYMQVGVVEKEYWNVPLLVWTFRIFYLGVGGYAFYHSIHTLFWQEKVIDYMVLVLMLWRIYRQSSPLLFLCTKGIVVRRRPTNLEERIRAFWEDESFYLFCSYEQIIGFTEDWNYLHIQMIMERGILIIPIDLQYVSYNDKIEIAHIVKNKSQES